MKNLLLCIVLCTITFFGYGQTGTITGKIVDPDSREGLVGANVIVKGTNQGVITDVDGRFRLADIPAGRTVLVISYVGYENREVSTQVKAGETTDIGEVNIEPGIIGLEGVEVIASIAIDRKTPVAVSTLKSREIETKVGNQEFPEILRYTPSTYVTKQGGGFGDSRINVRGFDQRNTAVLINGVPVNDMENGWVYWSNWAGLSDVTSRMQVQRGLSASKLAISSVGGTINIITNAAEMDEGGSFGVSVGNDGYQKYGLVLSTGLGDNGWAFTVQGTHTLGNGYVDGTKFRAYSYFASVAKVINESHSLNFTALGAPQWHHQRTIGSFDGITIDTYWDTEVTTDADGQIEDVKFLEENHPRGIRYNHLWGEYNGEEFTWRRNFYHKPKVFMNHYWTISNTTSVNSTAYLSFGRGGGTGPRGRLPGFKFETHPVFKDNRYGSGVPGQVRFDEIDQWNSGVSVPDFGVDKVTWYEFNSDSIDNRRGFFGDKYVNTSRYGLVRRASMNSHNWWGVLSSLTHEFSDVLNLTAGIDYRHYRGIHYRRMDNLLGADAYFTNTNINIGGEFITQEKPSSALANLKNDRKLNYYNDGLVQWGGVFTQLEYSSGDVSAHVSGALSNQGYKRIDYFNYYHSDEMNAEAGLSANMETDWVNMLGGNVKAGANYNINANHNVFANAGYFSRQPNFDAVFLNFVNEINEDRMNEKVSSFELGYGYRSEFINANMNLYRTTWTDRFLQRGVQLPVEGTANLSGITQVHSGVEVEGTGEIAEGLTLDAMVSVGDWTYGGDIQVDIFDDNQNKVGEKTLYLQDVKVGDAAQTTYRLGLNYQVIEGLRVYGSFYHAANLYADYSVASTDEFDEPGGQALKLPAYNLVDGGLYYDFNVGGVDMSWKLNVNNVLDELYIAESETNKTDPAEFGENRAFFGFGRTWNTGLKVKF